jgi:hypothetical protein
LWNAPKPEIGGSVQAGKTNVATEIPFWGCPVMSFKASLPFHGMRQGFAASERDPNGPYCNISKS